MLPLPQVALLPSLNAGGASGGPPLLACAESHTVSLWDLRQKGEVHRLAVSAGGAPSRIYRWVLNFCNAAVVVMELHHRLCHRPGAAPSRFTGVKV